MRKWLLIGTAVLGLGIAWYILTDPSAEEAIPGGMSNHEVDQTFDPYLSESGQDAPETGASPADEAGDPGTTEDPTIDDPSGRNGDDVSRDNDAGGDPTAETRGADTGGTETLADGSRAEPAKSNDGSNPDAHGLSTTEARRIADEYLSIASTDPDRLMDRYAERVNYYDEGTVDRSDVLRDKRTYLARWPERSYRRISDVQITDAGAADLIRFTYEFRVSGGSRNAEGRGWAELGMQRRDGDLIIVSERGGVID